MKRNICDALDYGRRRSSATIRFDPGDHLSGKLGKAGNVREFDSCQGNMREVSGGDLVRENFLKLFIVSCIFASVQVF